MAADSQNRLSDLYRRALERAPGERSAFLQQECDGDDVLRLEVESMLQYEAASAGFLERPAAACVTGSMMGQIGPYRLFERLGVGGMGEVYRAHDSKLGRDVAIKILPLHFTADPERRARFAREARLLATLNHPHIGAIYGLEESDGLTALVLELVDGPTLAERLESGPPLSIAQAVALARQIAEALEAAHDKGIVHRDLKPANIILQGAANPVSRDLRAKVLDFGLAKPVTVASEDVTQHAGSVGSTVEGRILGTPAYMSPEQARGLTIDKRTDIWAFGCVLFEMLAGIRAFEGKTVTDTLAQILEREPDWSRLPRETPARIRTLLDRCLRKDPRRRLHDIADAVLELDDAPESSVLTNAVVDSTNRRRSNREWLAWILAGAMGLGVLVLTVAYLRVIQSPLAEIVEFPLVPAENSRFARGMAMSPDGRHLAFAASYQGTSMIWVRTLGTTALRRLPGTEGGHSPFWRPDSQALGFFANGKLKTIGLSGSSPVTLCDAVEPQQVSRSSGTWNDKDVIAFTFADNPIYQVSAVGSTCDSKPVTSRAPTETAHRWPQFLPDGEHFLYLAAGSTPELRVGSLSSKTAVSVERLESNAAYAAGHLLFVRGGNLMAQPFNLHNLRLDEKSAPVVLATDVDVEPGFWRGRFSVSNTGRLVYGGATLQTQLTWFDRQSRPMGIVGDPGLFLNLDLSPDGLRVAVSRLVETGSRRQSDIWLIELDRGRSRPLTDNPAMEFDPAWGQDGRVAFNSNRNNNKWRLFVRPSDGSGQDEPLTPPEQSAVGPDWSGDGRFIVYTNIAGGPSTGSDLWTLDMAGDRKPTKFLATSANESNGVFSPDSHWIAYESNASGRPEVYVRAFPGATHLSQISRDGGRYPRWRGDGKEVYFLAPDNSIMAADTTIDHTRGAVAGVPKPVVSVDFTPGGNRPYAVTKDGQRFLLARPLPSPPLTVVLNWPTMLGR